MANHLTEISRENITKVFQFGSTSQATENEFFGGKVVEK